MCGIAGFVTKHDQINFVELLTNMGLEIKRRGPDDSGIWYDEKFRLGFAHRRLSILDLSPLGHQPMHSNNKRFTIIFNGEIYNHLKLRDYINLKYDNIIWKSNSDTETILVLIEIYGVTDAIKKLVGMFSIALFDGLNKHLYLIRDRLGEKPLYYGWQNKTFLFSSELKPFHKHPDFNKEIDLQSLSLYFKYNYIPCPSSIYKGINKLTPGTIFKLDLNNFESTQTAFWSLEEEIKVAKSSKSKTFNEHTLFLENLLKDSIKDQMLSDVPLGAFLSGGIDSSLIVSLMSNISKTPIKTFTIGFYESEYNEAIYAKQIADHLGTDHTELYVTSDQARSIIPDLALMYDEPFSDSSQIPTYLVSKLAKNNVTVSLSGDAGDELFAGYNRYLLVSKYWPYISFIPLFFRKFIKILIQIFPLEFYDYISKFSAKVLKNKSIFPKNFGDKIFKFSNLLLSKNQEDLYDKLITHWSEDDNLLLNYTKSNKFNNQKFSSLSSIEKMMAFDTITYLPDDILVKVDRAAMYNSLETRVPFLDHRVVEYAWSIPLNFKIKDGKSKYILREILYKYIPKKLLERPKMGFGVPIGSWLRGPLKEWAENLITEEKIKNAGILNYDVIKQKWDEHQSGSYNWQYHLWDILIFQAWYENQK